MSGFAQGAYIDDQRVVWKPDGSLDELGRYVDERGYVHLSSGELDGNWFIDAQGQPHDGQGMPSGPPLGIPHSWTVFFEPNPDESVGWGGALTEPGEATAEAIMRRQIDERGAGLSDTEATKPGAGALDTFSTGLRRPEGAPYAAGYAEGPASRKSAYEHEETQVAWRAPNNPALAATDGWVTAYEDRGTIADRAARTNPNDPTARGFVLASDGSPVDGRWAWVVDEQTGYLLLFDPHFTEATSPEGVTGPVASRRDVPSLLSLGYKVRSAHHTTPVAGMPVKGAGMVTLDHGRIVEITDESGHYRPDAAQQFMALQELIKQGYDLDSAKVMLTGRGGGRPTDKAEWLDEAAQANPLYPTDDVSLRQEQFAQTQGDEYQIRAKMALNEQIQARGQTPPATESPDIPPPPPDAEHHVDDGLPASSDVSDGVPAPPPPDTEGSYGVRIPAAPDPYGVRIPAGASGDDAQTGGDFDREQDSRASEAEDNYQNVDADEQYVEQARAYLAAAGRPAFRDWFRTLPTETQDQLRKDPELAAATQAPTPPTWTPGEQDHTAAATANATFVDALPDRVSATFTVAGFLLLIGDGHADQHQAYANAAPDAARGQVTVRKAGLGRGAGSLTFTGVPPAKHEVVRSAVARFSRKEVRFGQ
jgi:hypothetical protein